MNVRPGTYEKPLITLFYCKIATQSVFLKLIHKVKLFGLFVYNTMLRIHIEQCGISLVGVFVIFFVWPRRILNSYFLDELRFNRMLIYRKLLLFMLNHLENFRKF